LLFLPEVSINLADDEEIDDMMTEAGFNTVFIGIRKHPMMIVLVECKYIPNKGRDLNAMVKTIQNHGLGGTGRLYCRGFDNDSSLLLFEKQISFIQRRAGHLYGYGRPSNCFSSYQAISPSDE